MGNILSLTNAVPVPPTSEIGGPTSQSYGYDDLYRLTHAEGSFQQAAATQLYRLDQSYDSVHNITR